MAKVCPKLVTVCTQTVRSLLNAATSNSTTSHGTFMTACNRACPSWRQCHWLSIITVFSVSWSMQISRAVPLNVLITFVSKQQHSVKNQPMISTLIRRVDVTVFKTQLPLWFRWCSCTAESAVASAQLRFRERSCVTCVTCDVNLQYFSDDMFLLQINEMITVLCSSNWYF